MLDGVEDVTYWVHRFLYLFPFYKKFCNRKIIKHRKYICSLQSCRLGHFNVLPFLFFARFIVVNFTFGFPYFTSQIWMMYFTLQIRISEFHFTNTDFRVSLHKFGFPNFTSQIRISEFHFTNTDFRISLHKFGFPNFTSQIRISEFHFTNTDFQISIHKCNIIL